MKIESRKETDSLRLIIKKCHHCGHIMESVTEVQKCHHCHKAFLPLNYFAKVHAKNSKEFENLFGSSQEIHEEDIVKGLVVLW